MKHMRGVRGLARACLLACVVAGMLAATPTPAEAGIRDWVKKAAQWFADTFAQPVFHDADGSVISGNVF